MLTIPILLSIIDLAVSDDNPIVQTVYGKVQGEPLDTFNGNIFYAFQGIPFAEPPVGDLRFQPPQTAKNWDGVLDSQNSKKRCIQFSSIFSSSDETEDCLYLNVYTPQLPNEHQNVSLPVMVYIHGGAFVYGSNGIDEIRPHKMMDYDIVIVTVQYRLGFLGFVSTGDLECPGNNGFKDQQFALRWVQANIKNFGGDPTRVTVAGQSAGAASAGYQLLGSNTDGLFRGAIQASGSSLGTWTFQTNPSSYAYQIASLIDPAIDEKNSTQELMKFFKTVNVSQIKTASTLLFGKDSFVAFLNAYKGFLFAGVMEPEHDGAFLTQAAYEKFESGNFKAVPTFIGITSEEGLSFADDPNFTEILAGYDASPELLVSPNMHITNQGIKRKVGNYIRKLYVGDDLLQENIGPSVKLLSDVGFGRPNIKQAKLQAKYSDVYFYEFAYSGELGRQGKAVNYISGADSVGHSEDLMYLFPKTREEIEKYSVEDIITIDRIVLLWTNFVKYLNPTPMPSPTLQNVSWPKICRDSFPYLVINETVEVEYDLKKKMVDEYSRLYDLYAVPPLDTY